MAISWLFRRPGPVPAVDEVRLLAEARHLGVWPRWEDLTPERLRELSAERGLDLATAVVFDRLLASPVHGPFVRAVDATPLHELPRLSGKLLIVPAHFYREQPGYGGDGTIVRRVATALGLDVELIATPSTGSLPEAVRLVSEALRSEPAPVTLVTLSKGGADVRVALEDDPSLAAKVQVWVNLCGLVQGSPLLREIVENPFWQRALMRTLFRTQGMDMEVLRDLTGAPETRLTRPLALPEGLRVVSVVGVPLACHLSGSVLARYHRLSPLGPNDGSALIREAIVEPGTVYPLWGADHYFRVPQASPLLYRLFVWLSRNL